MVDDTNPFHRTVKISRKILVSLGKEQDMNLLFISGAEIFVVALVVYLLFGSKRLPEIAKGLGKGVKEFKKATNDIKKEISDAASDLEKPTKS